MFVTFIKINNIKTKIFLLLGKYWTKNRLKYFTFPRISTRNQSLDFCLNNNGTLIYWTNSSEQEILRSKNF